MNISKTLFINYLRCNRYVALNDLYLKNINKNNHLDELLLEENAVFKQSILSSMFDEEEDLINKDNTNLTTMLPYYNELEMISGKAINDKFKGNVTYSLDTYQQKKFSLKYKNHTFYAFLDGFQEDSEYVRIFETKATTSNKFSSNNFNYRYKEDDVYINEGFFILDNNGVYVPKEDVSKDLPETYYKKEQQLFNRQHNIGKYIYDLAFQRYIMENGFSTNKKKEYYLVVLNHEYIYDGKVDSKFNPIYNNDLVRFYNLTSLTTKMIKLIEDDLDLVVDRVNNMNIDEVSVGNYCQKGKNTECLFYDICHKKIPSKNSVFVYLGRHNGFIDEEGTKHDLYDLINEGYYHALDIPKNYLNRRTNQIQREVIESNIPYINYDKIKAGLDLLKYPIYHLDFETFNAPLPRYNNESPYTQSLFQYSIHIEKEEGIVDKDKDHYGYLANDHTDHRLKLLESMLSVIKEDQGSVLVYNISFEKKRLEELQVLYPKYYNRLEDIINRLFDLKDIVQNNSKLYTSLGFNKEEASLFNYYHTDLNGSFSIKKVLPIFSNLSYSDLEVSNGIEAMASYARYNDLNKEELSILQNNMVEYCKQDTWAMVEILRGLRNLEVKREENVNNI